MSCECECNCQLELDDMLAQLSEENKSIQRTLVQIRLSVELLGKERKEEKIKRRERTWPA